MAERTVPILPSRDLRESLAFYEALGFENRGAPPEEWDYLILGRGGLELHFYAAPDTDPLTTLVVEIAAALVEAGLPLHDAPQGHPAGGVSLMPELAVGGVVVSWRPHDRMTVHHHRGAAADVAVQRSMNAAVAAVLTDLGFVLESFGANGSALVTALR